MDLVGAIAIVLALGGLALLWRSLNPPPPLELTERGILDRRLRLGWIAWSEIDGAYMPNVKDTNCVRLRLSVGPRLARRIRRRRAAATVDPEHPGSAEVLLDLSDTQMSAVGILQQILAFGDGIESGGPPPAPARGSSGSPAS